MTEREMTPDVFTTGYTGTPGHRAFYLQARTEADTFTFALEKAQVSVLAEKLGELLLMIDREDTISGAQPVRDPALETEVTEPELRVGTIGLAYDEGTDVVSLLIEPSTADDEPDEDGDTVRFLLRRDQVRSFILHAMAVVAEGRPLCQLCGLPMDPEGHACPASNGHHPAA
ncbi:MAG: DUF3090 family protein [Actinomycetota bacterium]